MRLFRYDRSRYGGGLLVYVKDGLPAKQLYTCQFRNDTEVIVKELNLKKQKWLLLCLYQC